MASYDFGLTREEFGELTPGEFRALCKRRNIRIKYERYANALTASAVYNVNRRSEETPTVTAFDFIRDEIDAEKKEQRNKAKSFVKTAFNVRLGTPMEKILEIKVKVIADLKAAGYTDAEEIVYECFPHLKDK